MRRLVLTSVFAVSTAVLGACSGTADNTKPATPTPAPVKTASPIQEASPITTGTPKTTTSPEVKKDEKGTNVNKEAKPAATPKAK
ncbi:MAG: hypothetical protein JO053_15890 [Acidobacteria bacterium]|nr:hypothetical protein [Acidobacteriota bacterium]